MAVHNDHIENRVKDLARAEADILKALQDVENQRRSLEDSLQVIRLERYELTEASAPGPLFSSALLQNKESHIPYKQLYHCAYCADTGCNGCRPDRSC